MSVRSRLLWSTQGSPASGASLTLLTVPTDRLAIVKDVRFVDAAVGGPHTWILNLTVNGGTTQAVRKYVTNFLDIVVDTGWFLCLGEGDVLKLTNQNAVALGVQCTGSGALLLGDPA